MLDIHNYKKRLVRTLGNIQLYLEKGNPKDKYIKMKKGRNFKLNLKLVSTVDLHKLNKDLWGKRSIFILTKH